MTIEFYVPKLATPRDMPEFRLWLNKEWQTGGNFAQSVTHVYPNLDQLESAQYAEWEQLATQDATLWWVGSEMVDLIEASSSSIPNDLIAAELPAVSVAGIVYFERPFVGTDATTGKPMLIDLIVWMLTKNTKHDHMISVSSYRRHVFDGSKDIDSLMEEFETKAYATTHEAETGNQTLWMPLGRSDWPISYPINKKHVETLTDIQVLSMIEDRRIISSIFLLLTQEKLAAQTVEYPERHVRKRSERAGIQRGLSNVNVVNVGKPKHRYTPSGEQVHVDWANRWVVNGHWRWQPCGSGRSERKLIFIAPHIKGPESKPLKIKTTVNAWTETNLR